LRERPREIPLLAHAFLEQGCARLSRGPLEISAPAMQALCAHDWQGNVRELKNAMEFAAASAESEANDIEPWHLPDRISQEVAHGRESSGVSPGQAHKRFRPLAEELRELEKQRM